MRFLIRHARNGAQRERPCGGGKEEVLRHVSMNFYHLEHNGSQPPLQAFSLTWSKNLLSSISHEPEQCRAARGWLDWTTQELARRAGVGLSTVREFEKGERTPIPNNLAAIRRAIEAAGIHLVFGPSGEAVGIALYRRFRR